MRKYFKELPKPIKIPIKLIASIADNTINFIIYILISAINFALGRRLFLKMIHRVYNQMPTSFLSEGIVFEGTYRIPFIRGVTVATKEPDTINFLNDFVNPGDTFFDIGANIGVFSLYAAIKRDANVIAFEPSAENYAILNRNIYLNDISNKISAFNLAAHNTLMCERLNLSMLTPGKAGHGFGIKRAGDMYVEYEPEFCQAVLGVRIDDFTKMANIPFPNHIKVDVDGNEPKVFDGLTGILDNPQLKSISLELNIEDREQDRNLRKILHEHSFVELTDPKYVVIQACRNYFFVRQ